MAELSEDDFLDMSDEDFAKLSERDLAGVTAAVEEEEGTPVEVIPAEDLDVPKAEEEDDPTAEEDPEVDEEEGDPDEALPEEEKAALVADKAKDSKTSMDEPEDKVPKETPDYKALYEGMLSGFQANGREVIPKSPEDLIRLAQQGANYHQKMAGMKPARRALKTLESNGLLEGDELNFLIDLKNGNPEALAKFMKDQAINPMEVDTEAGAKYTPTDHSASDTSIELDEVLNDIQGTPTFNKTVTVVTKEWDESSRVEISRQPRIMAVINEQMADGTYDKVTDAVNYERSLGKLNGISDFDAYKDMGNRMQAAGAFDVKTTAQEQVKTKAPVKATPDPAAELKRKAQKKAASPTRGKGKVAKVPANFNPLDMSDEEFLKFDPKLIGIK